MQMDLLKDKASLSFTPSPRKLSEMLIEPQSTIHGDFMYNDDSNANNNCHHHGDGGATTGLDMNVNNLTGGGNVNMNTKMNTSGNANNADGGNEKGNKTDKRGQAMTTDKDGYVQFASSTSSGNAMNSKSSSSGHHRRSLSGLFSGADVLEIYVQLVWNDQCQGVGGWYGE